MRQTTVRCFAGVHVSCSRNNGLLSVTARPSGAPQQNAGRGYLYPFAAPRTDDRLHGGADQGPGSQRPKSRCRMPSINLAGQVSPRPRRWLSTTQAGLPIERPEPERLEAVERLALPVHEEAPDPMFAQG